MAGAAARVPRQPKKQSTVVPSVAEMGGAKSAVERIAAAAKHYWSSHEFVGPHDYAEALNARHRFYTVAGSELKTLEQVQVAIARDGRVESFE